MTGDSGTQKSLIVREDLCHRGLCDREATHRIVFTEPKAGNTEPFGYCEEHALEHHGEKYTGTEMYEGITDETVTAWSYVNE